LGALRASPLEDLGLSAALRLLAETMAARNRWALRLELPCAPYVLPPAVEETLYRVAQEGLTNVERHARAQVVSVGLRVDGGGVLLRIEDDGVGFAARGGGAEQGAFGLVGMQERSRLIGGVLEIGGGQDKGTVLTLAAAAPFAGQKGDG
jgi:signal transduction histidine kinase